MLTLNHLSVVLVALFRYKTKLNGLIRFRLILIMNSLSYYFYHLIIVSVTIEIIGLLRYSDHNYAALCSFDVGYYICLLNLIIFTICILHIDITEKKLRCFLFLHWNRHNKKMKTKKIDNEEQRKQRLVFFFVSFKLISYSEKSYGEKLTFKA